MRKTVKNKKGYSLLEMLVTLVVFAVLVTMIVQVLLISIESSRKIAVRSKLRGDLSEIAVMMRRDFRNASKIDTANCIASTGSFNFNGQNYNSGCVFDLQSSTYAWIIGSSSNTCATGKICKFIQTAGGYDLFYESSELLDIDGNRSRIEFQEFADDVTGSRGIVLSTLVADPTASKNIGVPTQVRQISVFTRNF